MISLNEIFDLPQRPEKPRESGITMVIDNGMGLTRSQCIIEEAGHLIDYVKLGWCTSLVTPGVKEKVKLFGDAGIPVCLGGTFFELAHQQNRIDKYLEFAKYVGVSSVEVSDGSIDMPQETKLDYIRTFAKQFRVLSEYGSKDSSVVQQPSKWVRSMQLELEAGAWKSIAEGRESGTAGMYRGSSELRSGLVDEIADMISPENLIWEAPQKHQQVAFIKRFGPNVNLGNIAIDGIVPLETLRLGMRGDTLAHFHVDQ